MTGRFQEVNKLKERLDSYRPIPEEKRSASNDTFRIEFTYHNNALEGSTMTLSETSLFIQEGLTSHGKSLLDYIRVTAHLRALESIDAIIANGITLSEDLIAGLHACLSSREITMGDSAPQSITAAHSPYRVENTHSILPDGNVHNFTRFSRIPEEMRNLITWYMENKDALHPIELSAMVHYRLLAIHPFMGGNGRLSRLIMNLLLMQRGYTPAIIRVTDKAEYLECLYMADKGSFEMLISIVESAVIKTMTQLLNLIEGKEEIDLQNRDGRSETSRRDYSIPLTMTKDIETERSECVERLHYILQNQIECLIEKQGLIHERGEITDTVQISSREGHIFFNLTGHIKIQDVFGKGYIYNTLNERNIIPLFDVEEDLLISSRHYVNYISEKGISLLLELIPGKNYAPSSFLSFNIIPIRLAVYIVYAIMIGRMEGEEEVVYCKKTDMIQGSYRITDWKESEVEEFLVGGFNEFLGEIKSRLKIEECI